MNVLLAIWVVSSIVASAVGLLMLNKKLHPNPCDSCKNLTRKNRRGGGTWRYHCSCRFGWFDKAPEYCASYERRDDNA